MAHLAAGLAVFYGVILIVSASSCYRPNESRLGRRSGSEHRRVGTQWDRAGLPGPLGSEVLPTSRTVTPKAEASDEQLRQKGQNA